jgi:hypothetical protein
MKTEIVGAAIGALILTTTLSPAQTGGWNSDSVDNFQTIEQFRANWNSLLDKARASSVQRSCENGLCYWDWQLRPGVKAKMVESHNHTGQAFYCFQTDSSPTWDCYGNTLNKWVWNPPGSNAVAEAPPDSPIDNATPPDTSEAAPDTNGSFSVPLVIEDGGIKTTVGLGPMFYNMTIDTGATSGLVTESIAAILLSRGDAERAGFANSTIADGSTRQEPLISVANVTLNGHTVHNVIFGVGPDSGGMLFGLLPLAKFGKFTIDAANSQMQFN